MSSIWSDAVSLFFPWNCFACGEPLFKGESCICTLCRNDLPQIDNQHGVENVVMRKFHGMVLLNFAFAFLSYQKEGKVQSLMHHLKYGNRPEIGVVLGRWFAGKLVDQGFADTWDLILPVPLHKSKLRNRGYNQSDGFAEGLSEILEIPWSNKLLKRIKRSASQTTKGRWERHENVENIFQVTDPESIKRKRLLLVDDIITTGATLQACIRPLMEAKAEELSVAAIALSQ